MAAFVLALVGGSVLSVVLGAVALSRTRRHLTGGRGLAVAGVVLGSLEVLAGLVVAAVVVVTGVGVSLAARSPRSAPAATAPAATAPAEPAPADPRPVPGAADPAAPAVPREVLIDDLAAGDCFDEHAGSLDTGTVLVADCTVAHGGEVIAVHSVAEVFHDFFPGDEALTAEADARCGPAVGEAAAGAGLGDAALRYSYYFPTERDWDAGSRLVQCNLVGGSGGSLTGSLTAGTLSAW